MGKIFLATGILASLLVLGAPSPASAADATGAQGAAPSDVYFYPSVYFPGLESVGGDAARILVKPDTLGLYIVQLYKFFTGATAIVALFMVTYGGLLWLLAGGNQGSISQAKETITGALAGMLIALLSYALLASISRGLVSFRSLDTTVVASHGSSGSYGIAYPDCTSPGMAQLRTDDNLTVLPEVSSPCLQENAASSLRFAAADLRSSSRDVHHVLLKSAHRSMATQMSLVQQYCPACVAGNPGNWQQVCGSPSLPSAEPGGCSQAVCNPNKSTRGCAHMQGNAVDVRCEDNEKYGPCQLELEVAMYANGFCRLDSESWHFELPKLSGGCVVEPPDPTTGLRAGCPDCCNSRTGKIGDTDTPCLENQG